MPEKGTLGVRVYTSRAQIPVLGATVVITQKAKSGKFDVLSLQVTDNSGNIKSISMDTPMSEESTEPYGDVPPFAQCDIWVEHPDYEFLMIQDVQVFPNVESMQLVELIPQVDGVPWLDYPNVWEIPKQDL